MHIIFRVCALFGSICAAFHRVQHTFYHFSSRIHLAQNGKQLEALKYERGLESAKLILMKGLDSVQNPSDFLEAGFGMQGVSPNMGGG
jgi:hypothetical protein